MELNVKFTSLEELNWFCLCQANNSGLAQALLKANEQTFENIEIIKYFQRKKFKLNERQWGWIFDFDDDRHCLKRELPRQCGKTFFLAGLSSYLISQERKILFFARNLQMLNYFKETMNMFEPFSKEKRQQFKEYFYPILIKTDRVFNVGYDYAIGDEVDYYDALPKLRGMDVKYVFLGS